jgi:quercetin dioxygenase-like cupin family protein
MAESGIHPLSSWLLSDELAAVRAEAVRDGSRVTRMLLKSTEVRVAVVGMAKGVTWPQHTAKGRVVVKIEDGRVEVRAAAGSSELSAGMMMGLDPGEPHDVRALEDTVFLLIVAG